MAEVRLWFTLVGCGVYHCITNVITMYVYNTSYNMVTHSCGHNLLCTYAIIYIYIQYAYTTIIHVIVASLKQLSM